MLWEFIYATNLNFQTYLLLCLFVFQEVLPPWAQMLLIIKRRKVLALLYDYLSYHLTVHVYKIVLVHRLSLIIVGGFFKWLNSILCSCLASCCMSARGPGTCLLSPAALGKWDLSWSHGARIHSCHLTFEPVGYFKPNLVQR